MQPSLQRKSRSNRPLTQFACGCLDLFMSINTYRTERTRGNTTVKCYKEGSVKKFQAFVYDEQIIEVVTYDDEPVRVSVSAGDSFEADGSPNEDIKERLNGLLDALGAYQVLPDGVRLFKDRDEEIFYLGRGDVKVPVGLLYAREVLIQAGVAELVLSHDELIC
jgi:hypothetical protein